MQRKAAAPATAMPSASAPQSAPAGAAPRLSVSSPAAARMTGIASRNDRRAAAGRAMPSTRAAVMVTPERDAPGISASAWPQPIHSACLKPISRIRVSYCGRRSAHTIRTANSAPATAMSRGSRNDASTVSCSSRPSTPTGSDATTIINPSRAEGPGGARYRSQARHSPRIAASSRRENAITAMRLPKCTATSKAMPWSSQPSQAGTRIRCAELEIGRNSVTPCSRASRTICQRLMRRPPGPQDRGRGPVPATQAGHVRRTRSGSGFPRWPAPGT